MTVRTRCQLRQAPFLQRNLTRRVQALQDSVAMGNIVSSPVHKGSHHNHHRHHHSLDGDDDGAPPLKRCRLTSPDAHLIASPKTSDSRSALRIEVLKVFHKDSKKVRINGNGIVPVPRDVINTKASCRVTISEPGPGGRSRVLHCQSQVCDLKVFRNPIGPHRVARIYLPRPFFVPEESIFVNRPDDETFGLSDSYQVLVELEAAHDGHWPPLDATDFGTHSGIPNAASTRGRSWILSSQYDKNFGKLKGPLSISSRYSSQELACPTDYVMDIEMRWTSGFKALRRLEKGSKPCINAIDPSSDLLTDDFFVSSVSGLINGTSDANKERAAEESLDNAEDSEGAHTPSRSLRTRENKNYNLRVLSDQAQGRERKRRARGAQTALISGQVTYLLPSDQPVCLDYFRCVTCGVFHQTMLHLQLHLQTFHPGYQYLFETTSQGPQFRVTSLSESLPSHSKKYELRPPIKPFNLQSLIAGDQSWITSRLGLDAADDVFKVSSKELYDRPPSESPLPIPKNPMQLRRGRSKRARVLVPDIPHALFDPISKAQLVPGQEVPRSEPDENWLIQKHRENISDFSDVTPAEKEFIWQWDEHILKKHISSAAYIPRAWLDFAQNKADWLVAAEQRMQEFGKHTSVLLARDVLDDDTVQEAFCYINEARMKQQMKSDETEATKLSEIATKHSPKAAQIHRNANGCTVCQLPVLGPSILICANKTCSHRLYHAHCAEQDVSLLGDKRKWLCSKCNGPGTSGTSSKN